MKKILILLIIPLVLCGCTENLDRSRLADRTVVQALAIDYDPVCERYRLSAWLFSSGGGEKVDPAQENVELFSSTGSTLCEASGELSELCGREIFLSQTRLVVLGEGFQNEPLQLCGTLGLLHSELDCPLSSLICTSDSAGELMKYRFKDGITSAERPVSMIKNAASLGRAVKVTLLDALCAVYSDKTAYIPRFTEDTERENIKLKGSRALSASGLSEVLSDSETLRGAINNSSIKSVEFGFTYLGEEKLCTASGIEIQENGAGRSAQASVLAEIRLKNGEKPCEACRQAALKALEEMIF